MKRIVALNQTVLEEKYKAELIAFFDSFVRGDQTVESDIDILVEFS